MNRSILREQLAIVVDATVAYLQQAGYQLPDDLMPIKATRDKREPLRKEKTELEEKITRMFARQFRIMGERVRTWAETLPRAKAVIDIPTWLLEWESEFESSLITVIVKAMKDSGGLWFSTNPIQFDNTGFNARAYRVARDMVGEMIRGVDEVTLATVRDAVQSFVTTPGMTIGDLADALPFGESRAEMIAVTETTRAYAEGERQAGIELREKYPDVPVIKTWFTNEDERVCEICGGLEGQEVPIEEPFMLDGIEYPEPPAHPRCRCWMSSRTKING